MAELEIRFPVLTRGALDIFSIRKSFARSRKGGRADRANLKKEPTSSG